MLQVTLLSPNSFFCPRSCKKLYGPPPSPHYYYLIFGKHTNKAVDYNG